MLVQIEICDCDVVVRKGHFIRNLIEICKSIKVQPFLVVDGRTVIEDYVSIWTLRNFQKTYVHIEKSLFS